MLGGGRNHKYIDIDASVHVPSILDTNCILENFFILCKIFYASFYFLETFPESVH